MRRSHGLLGRLCSIFFASPLFWCRRTSVGSTRIFLAQVGSRDWQSRAFATVCDGGATWLHRCDRVALDGRSALLGTQHPTTCCGLRPLGLPSGWGYTRGATRGWPASNRTPTEPNRANAPPCRMATEAKRAHSNMVIDLTALTSCCPFLPTPERVRQFQVAKPGFKISTAYVASAKRSRSMIRRRSGVQPSRASRRPPQARSNAPSLAPRFGG
jgi:hypothetical protein